MAPWKRTLWLVLLASTFLFGDIVKRKDGATFDGKIIERDDQHVKVMTKMGPVVIPASDIAEIISRKSEVEVRDEKFLALTPADPAGYFDAGKWCLGELKDEGGGVRLLTLAMYYDAKWYAPAQILLGDWFEKRDKTRSAACYLAALLADPANPDAIERYSRVKDLVTTQRSGADRALLNGIEALANGRLEDAAKALESGRVSRLRSKCEGLLGTEIEGLIAYCHRTDCKACHGTGQMECPTCHGKLALDCPQCHGCGIRVTQSVKMGRQVSTCPVCNGWGVVVCTQCCPVRMSPPVMNPATGKMQSPGPLTAFPVVAGETTQKPSFVWEGGGTVPCKLCKGTNARTVAPPNLSGVAACEAWLQRQTSGKLSLVEESESRMQRVGGVGKIEGAEKYIAEPVWYVDKEGRGNWVSVDFRRRNDPSFRYEPKSGGSMTVKPDEVRKDAIALAPDGSNWAGFEDKVRQTCAGGVRATQVYSTEFAAAVPQGDASAGPYVASSSDARLKPCMVQVCDTFSTRRILLECQGGQGLALRGGLNLASVPNCARVRIYYVLSDARDEIAPSGARDVATTHLTVKPILIDLVDAAGNILQSAQ